MSKNEERKILKNLYLEMRQMKIPAFPNNESISNFIENIIELDSYYAGLALTAVEGGRVLINDLYAMGELRNTLNSIQAYDDEDKKALDECGLYFKKIEEVDQLLRKLC
jgi:hypothetical protein